MQLISIFYEVLFQSRVDITVSFLFLYQTFIFLPCFNLGLCSLALLEHICGAYMHLSSTVADIVTHGYIILQSQPDSHGHVIIV